MTIRIMTITTLGVLALPAVVGAQEASASAGASAEARIEVRRAPSDAERGGGGHRAPGATARGEADAGAQLLLAREALEEEGEHSPSWREVEAGASALAAGATVADLEAIRDHTPSGRSMEVSLHALAELTARGIASADAAAAISAHLARGTSDAALMQISSRARTVTELEASVVRGADAPAGAVGVGGAAAAGLRAPLGLAAGLTGGLTGSIRF